jgi:hypothetical protein
MPMTTSGVALRPCSTLNVLDNYATHKHARMHWFAHLPAIWPAYHRLARFGRRQRLKDNLSTGG